MRHNVKGRQFGRTANQRKALLRSLAIAVIEHERIETTVAKAKEARRIVEKLVTLSKTDNVHNRRQAFATLRNKEAVSKLFETLGPRFAERPGGYCRVLKLAKPRLGDAAPRAIIEFVERTIEVKVESDDDSAGDE